MKSTVLMDQLTIVLSLWFYFYLFIEFIEFLVSCKQVLSSNNLARLLQRMLAVGNIMNQGTRRGGASGFTLDSLIKMVNTKGIYCMLLFISLVFVSLHMRCGFSIPYCVIKM